MFSVFVNAWKVKEIRKKLLYTISVIALYRFGTAILIPGVQATSLSAMRQSEIYGMTMAQMLLGGGKNLLSVFALGIGPYITASIIMQLLTVAIPQLEALQKEGGEDGRQKINNITRYVAVAMAFLQASGTVYTYRTAFLYQNFLFYAVGVLTMVAGTTFIMWVSEQITSKGIGNGSSMIIFSNILASMPMAVNGLIGMIKTSGALGVVKVLGLLVFFLAVIAFVVYVQQGERRLPVQYSRKMGGSKMMGGHSSFIPIKVNIAGVISIIFAISLIQFPMVIGNFFGVANKGGFATVVKYLDINHPFGAVLYVVLIVFFTFFYTSIVFNPAEIAENMKKNGGAIPGIRSGVPTSQYITKVVNRVTVIGAFFFSLIALVPILLGFVLQESNVGFGGTTIVIVVGVALETVKQLESQLLMRHYKGFLNARDV